MNSLVQSIVKIRHLPRGIEVFLGVYMIAGALPKALNINHFAVQMSAYKVIEDKAFLPWAALATLFVEMALGMALVSGLRLRGLVLAAFEAMLVFFSALIVYAWVFHGLEDCGCFPLLKMSPPVSLAKNLLMFVLAGAAWFMIRPAGAPPSSGPSRFYPVVKVLLTLLIGAGAVGYALPRIEAAGPVMTENGGGDAFDFGQFTVDTVFGPVNLGEGDYLIPVLSMTCEECMAKVPALNDLSMQPGVPQMVSLCYEEKPGDLERFKSATLPQFAMHPLGDRPLLYFNLRGDDPFRLILLRNGRITAHWDGHVPSYEEVAAALDAAG